MPRWYRLSKVGPGLNCLRRRRERLRKLMAGPRRPLTDQEFIAKNDVLNRVYRVTEPPNPTITPLTPFHLRLQNRGWEAYYFLGKGMRKRRWQHQ